MRKQHHHLKLRYLLIMLTTITLTRCFSFTRHLSRVATPHRIVSGRTTSFHRIPLLIHESSNQLLPRRNLSNDPSPFFSIEHPTFSSLGIQSPILLERLHTNLNLTHPSVVQSSSYSSILSGDDVIIGAETGSGKTLAYLLPLMDDILLRKQNNDIHYDYCRAIILVPNKELVQQVTKMACTLSGGEQTLLWPPQSTTPPPPNPETTIRLAILPGGLSTPSDFKPFRNSLGGKGGGTSAPPVDLVIATPASVAPFGLSPRNIGFFSDIPTVVIDECDMLLEGGYSRQLNDVLMGFRRADKVVKNSDEEFYGNVTQHVFVAATLPDRGVKSVDSYLKKRFPKALRVKLESLHNARHTGLKMKTVWVEEDGRGERMDRLVDMLTGEEMEGEKVMVFLNTVEDVDGATDALRRAGINAIPYHAKIPPNERTSNLDTFRHYSPTLPTTTPPILVCTDLASRGLDIPGVTVIVQLQFALNVVAHLHRMGRCGRAGKRDGRGIIFYSSKERDLVNVVKAAESAQERMALEGGEVEDYEEVGKVREAFSRKRMFQKKRKKERRKGVSVSGGGEGGE